MLPSPHPVSAPPRVVLDSNVWIDILVFDDLAIRPIRAALENGSVLALIDTRCFAELTRVLDYPQFVPHLARLAIAPEVALATTLRLAQMVPPVDREALPDLPQCSDRDDQKFVELAFASGADWLLSKDRALLKLARRVARDFDFRIDLPAPFAARCTQTQDAAANLDPLSGSGPHAADALA